MPTHSKSLRSSLPSSFRMALAALFASTLLPGVVLAQDPAEEELQVPVASEHPALTIAKKTFDAVVLRPVGFVTTAVGGCLFVPAAVLASPGGRDPIDEALDRFVLTPWDYTADRPLGEF